MSRSNEAAVLASEEALERFAVQVAKYPVLLRNSATDNNCDGISRRAALLLLSRTVEPPLTIAALARVITRFKALYQRARDEVGSDARWVRAVDAALGAGSQGAAAARALMPLVARAHALRSLDARLVCGDGRARRVARRAWRRALRLVRDKWAALEERGEAGAAEARLAPPEWRVLDALALHDRAFRAMRERELTTPDGLVALGELVQLVREFRLHGAGGAAWRGAAAAWRRRGRLGSAALLRRRWHELAASARRALAAARGGAARPAPLLVALARRFPRLLTRPQPSWRRLVLAGALDDFITHTDTEDADEEPPPGPPPEADDDLILVEREIETVDLADDRLSDGDDDRPRVKRELLSPSPPREDPPGIDPKLLLRAVVVLERVDAWAAGGRGRSPRRVRLPDIEEVRRSQRSRLTAQVAPSAHEPRVSEREAGAEGPGAEADDEDDGCTLAADELAALLDRVREEEQPAGKARYCCVARREAVYTRAQRRYAAHAGKPPQQRDLHRERCGRRCGCCCAHLLRPPDVTRLARRARLLLADAVRALLPQSQLEDASAGSSSDSDSDSDSADDLECVADATGEEKRPAVSPTPAAAPAPTPAPPEKKRKKTKRRRSDAPEEEAAEERAPHRDPLEEWIRQKNIANRFFDLNLKKAVRPPTHPVQPPPQVAPPAVTPEPQVAPPAVTPEPQSTPEPQGNPPQSAPAPEEAVVVDLCDSDEEEPPATPHLLIEPLGADSSSRPVRIVRVAPARQAASLLRPAAPARRVFVLSPLRPDGGRGALARAEGAPPRNDVLPFIRKIIRMDGGAVPATPARDMATLSLIAPASAPQAEMAPRGRIVRTLRLRGPLAPAANPVGDSVQLLEYNTQRGHRVLTMVRGVGGAPIRLLTKDPLAEAVAVDPGPARADSEATGDIVELDDDSSEASDSEGGGAPR